MAVLSRSPALRAQQSCKGASRGTRRPFQSHHESPELALLRLLAVVDLAGINRALLGVRLKLKALIACISELVDTHFNCHIPLRFPGLCRE